MSQIPEPYKSAHKHSIHHRQELQASEVCGCFCCTESFPPHAIHDWIGADTARCPNCGIDAVLGSASGYELTPDFLEQMKLYWF